MSDIAPISRPTPASVGSTTRNAGLTPTQSAATRGTDKVELSLTAQLLSKLRQLPDVRQELVDRVKQEIAKGTYDSDDKLDAAIPAMMDDMA
ncbi:MAG: flagellar biosynthesis anti-sigma factor FlgM [Phycisphaeraceae bacterium]|nr:flagellar biosynthesis anti-sigma factor FlgM [Phycisphaeraceae bacterium]